MKEICAKRFKSNISIEPTKSYELAANQISEALSINLSLNTSGKFEEFVGYEACAFGISVNLICDPNSPDSPYDLDFYGYSESMGGETIDITDYILSLLKKRTDLICKKMK